MASASKILTVSYGTFSCTLEGFDDAFTTMKEIAQYFRELSAEDRYFGAVPPTPDAETLKRIAEREVRRRVEATLQDKKIFLRATEGQDDWEEPEPPRSPPYPPGESVAARLARLRSTVSRRRAEAGEPPRSIFSEEDGGERPEAARTLSGAAHAPRDGQEEAGGGVAAGSSTEPQAEPTAATPALDQAEPVEAGHAGGTGTAPEPAFPGSEAQAAGTPEGGAAEAAVAGEPAPAAGMVPPEVSEAEAEAEVEGGDGDRDKSPALPVDPGAARDAAPEDEPAGEADIPEMDPLKALQAEALAQAFSNDTADAGGEPAGTARTEDDAAGPADRPPERAEEQRPVEDSELPRESRSLADGAPEGLSEEDMPVDPADSKAVSADTSTAARQPGAAGAGVGAETAGAAPSGLPPRSTTGAERQLRDFFARLRDAETGAAKGADGRVEPGPGRVPGPAAPAEADSAEAAPPLQGEAMPPQEVPDVPGPAAEAPGPKDEAEAADEQARPRPRDGRSILEETNGSSTDDDSVTRLVKNANTRLEVAENQRRLSAFSHLKAAVAATVADRMFGTSREDEKAAEDKAELGRYRQDLSRVVQSRDDDEAGTGAGEEGPLRLGEPTATAAAQSGAPAGGAGDPDLDADDGDSDPGGAFTASRPFPEFAREAGVSDLPDLLEAAAAYLTEEEGRPLFSRPQIMRKVALMSREQEFSREDGLRAFGALLRQGRIQKVRRGQFSISRSSRFVKQGRGLPH